MSFLMIPSFDRLGRVRLRVLPNYDPPAVRGRPLHPSLLGSSSVLEVPSVVSGSDSPLAVTTHDAGQTRKRAPRIGHVLANQSMKYALYRNAVSHQQKRIVGVAIGKALSRGAETREGAVLRLRKRRFTTRFVVSGHAVEAGGER